MADVVDDLLPLIQDAFDTAVRRDAGLRKLQDVITSGKGTYSNVYTYALMLTRHCANTLLRYIKEENLPNGRLYYNIARRLLSPQLRSLSNMLGAACEDVQLAMNQKLGMMLNPITADFDTERADNLAMYVSGLETIEMARTAIGADVENFGLHYVDESIRKNVEFFGESGVSVKVQRIAHSTACEYCLGLAGTYDYDEVRRGSEIWSRHRGCKCTIVFNPTRQGSRDRQIVWDRYSDTLGYRRDV